MGQPALLKALIKALPQLLLPGQREGQSNLV